MTERRAGAAVRHCPHPCRGCGRLGNGEPACLIPEKTKPRPRNQGFAGLLRSTRKGAGLGSDRAFRQRFHERAALIHKAIPRAQPFAGHGFRVLPPTRNAPVFAVAAEKFRLLYFCGFAGRFSAHFVPLPEPSRAEFRRRGSPAGAARDRLAGRRDRAGSAGLPARAAWALAALVGGGAVTLAAGWPAWWRSGAASVRRGWRSGGCWWDGVEVGGGDRG